MSSFFDGFEDGNLDEWTVGGQGGSSDYNIITSSFEGTYAVEGDVVSGNNVNLDREIPSRDPNYLAGAISISSNDGFDDGELSFRTPGDSNIVTIAIGSDPRAFSCSSGVCVGVNINGTSVPLKTDVGTGNYQFVEFIGFDASNGTCDEIRVDGTTEASNVSFTSFNDEIAGLYLDTFGTGGYRSRYDSIEVGSPVDTETPTSIDTTSATLEGSLDDLEGNSSVDVNFRYRETGSSTWNNTTVQTLSSTGAFSESLSSLSQGTEYEYQAVWDDGTSVYTGDLTTFTTSTVVETEAATNIGVDSATLNGALNTLEGQSSVDVFFEYRETGSSTWNTTAVQTLSSTGSFSESLSSLSSGAEYEFRAKADDGTTVYDGDILTFNTLSDKDQYVGYFQNQSSTGTQTISDIPFEPDVIQFIVTNTNSSFDTQNTYSGGPFGFSHGFSDTVNNTHVALCSASGSASTNGQASESSNSYSVNMLITPSDGDNINGRIQGYVTSTSQGQFTMQWDTVAEQQYIVYRAFRFDSGEDFEVGTFNNPGSTGNQKITTGFEPNFLMVKQTPRLENMTQTIQDANNNGFMHGWACQNEDGSTSESVQSVSMNSSNINHHVFGAFDNKVIHTLWDTATSNTSAVEGRVEANLNSWDSDGFTLNYTNVNPHEGTNHVAIYLAVNSAKTPEVGMGLTPTSTGTQSITTNSAVEDVFTAMTPTNPGINQDGASGDNQSENTHGWVFGGRAHTGIQMSMGYSSNSNSVNDHRSMSSTSDVLKQPHTDENATLHGVDEADASNFSETGFDLNWTQIVTSADGTAFDQTVYTYWSLGTSGAVQESLSESLTVSESFDAVATLERQLSETVALNDALTTTLEKGGETFTQTLSETLTAAEKLSRKTSLSFSESVALAEVQSSKSTFLRSVAESTALSESFTSLKIIRTDLSEMVNFSDNTSNKVKILLPETVGVNDVLTDNAGFLTGQITLNGSGVSGVNVYAVKSGTGTFVGSDSTDGSGGYSIGRFTDEDVNGQSRVMVSADYFRLVDDFEDGDIDKWSGDTNQFAAQQDFVISGGYTGELDNPDGDLSAAEVSTTLDDFKGVEFKLALEEDSTDSSGFLHEHRFKVFNENGDRVGQVFVEVDVDVGEENVYWVGSNQSLLATGLNSGQVYRFEIIEYDAGAVGVRIDGDLKGVSRDLENGFSSFSEFKISNAYEDGLTTFEG